MSSHTTLSTTATATAGFVVALVIAGCGSTGTAAPSGSRQGQPPCFGSERVYESELVRGATPCGGARRYESDIVQQSLAQARAEANH
jgi:hypothetical protein